MISNVSEKIHSKKNNLNYPLNIAGKIRDPLHNTIPYTTYEKTIIDRPEFQRLRRIKQTAFIQYVFPGATHTRFEHSIGAMHIAGLLLSSLIANQNRLLNSLEEVIENANPNTKEQFLQTERANGSLLETKHGLNILENSPYLGQCLRFAALLHDCGHSALSHSGEKFMPSWEQLGQRLNDIKIPLWLNQALSNKVTKKNHSQQSIRHEIYTLLIIHKLFSYDKDFINEKMAQDVCSIIDTSIPPYPMGELENSKMQHLFHEVISGEIDVDRMDYLLRDSKECGVVYGFFDLSRILDSVGFYFNHSSKQYHLALRKSGISAYEDYLKARLSMYHQVYFHKTATACEAMLSHIKKHSNFQFPLNIDRYLKIDDNNICSLLNINDSNIAEELILERKLWKRVYEETIPFNQINSKKSLCDEILNHLNSLDIPCELIETSTNLTSFSPLNSNNIGAKLLVIIKHFNDLRFLEPINKHCSLINRIDEDFIIKRIYVPKVTQNGSLIDTKYIQKVISDKFN